LGYADVSEGITKKERKNSDPGPKKEREDDEEGEDDKHMDGRRRVSDAGSRHIQREYSNGSPESRRTVSKDQGYFDSKPLKARETSDREKDTRRNFGDYRDTAVFSEDGHSPLGNLSSP
jgi:hypothetical protein